MKLKRTMIAIILPFAIFSANAQTPESIRKSCPPIPSVNTLKIWALDECEAMSQKISDEVNGFHDKINTNNQFVYEKIEELKALGKIEEQKAGEKDKEQLDKTIKATTGKSIKELESMSDKETEAYANQMVKSMTGMTMEQLAALDGKSDAEILAAMQKSGAIDKAAQQAAAKPAATTVDVTKISRIHELQAEMQTLIQQVNAEVLRIEKEEAALKAKHEAMLKPGGEFAKLMEVKRKLNPYRGIGLISSNELAEAQRLCAQLRPLESSYYDKIIPEWLKFVNTLVETQKQLNSLENRIHAVSVELTDLQGLPATAAVASANNAKIRPWEEVRAYMNILSKCTDFFKPSS